jgi:hypothetical protein
MGATVMGVANRTKAVLRCDKIEETDPAIAASSATAVQRTPWPHQRMCFSVAICLLLFGLLLLCFAVFFNFASSAWLKSTTIGSVGIRIVGVGDKEVSIPNLEADREEDLGVDCEADLGVDCETDLMVDLDDEVGVACEDDLVADRSAGVLVVDREADLGVGFEAVFVTARGVDRAQARFGEDDDRGRVRDETILGTSSSAS